MKTRTSTQCAVASGFVTLISLCASCGGGGGGGGGGSGNGTPADLEATLNDLGVDTTATPRRDADGNPLPANYSPFGPTWAIAKTDELAVIGLEPNVTRKPFSLFDLSDGSGRGTFEVLDAKSDAQASWARQSSGSRALPSALRAACAADVDGDGLEETVIVYQDDLETHVVTIDDEPSGFATVDDFLGLESGVTNVAVQGLDADGDGTDEIAIGLTSDGEGLLLFAHRTNAGFEPFGPRIELARALSGSTLWLELAAGNLDHDRAQELLVVVNEERRAPPPPTLDSARYLVFDDEQSAFAKLREAQVQGRDQANTLRTACVASPAIGDVDGDGMGEILLGGLTEYARSCAAAHYLLLACDDAEHALAPLPGLYFEFLYSNCDSPNDPEVRTVHLNALDIDGDGRDEVEANQFVFQDWVEAAPWTEVHSDDGPDWRLPESAFWKAGDFGYLERNTSSVVVGDFNSDGREDLAIYRQDTDRIVIWEVPEASVPQTIHTQRLIPVTFENSQVPLNPILLPVNLDVDGPVLKYSGAEHRLVFGEPVVIAALAAAPFKQGIGQNSDACQTTFGNTESSSSEEERTVTISASASLGVNLDGGAMTQSEFELKVSGTFEATKVTSEAYNLSKSILFTSGPAEDLVVFSTVPLDQYIFTVVSHPDPAMVGQQVIVNLPREPITMQAERGFYNSKVQPGSPLIDARVFRHTIGEPASYPSRSDKSSLLAQHGGLGVGPVGVGQGTGETEVTLEVGSEVSSGGSLELGFEVDMELTAGSVLFGATVGASETNTLTVTSGHTTTYTGVVGAIDAADFGANRYSFGLFTYVYSDPSTGREFEVLDYWVE